MRIKVLKKNQKMCALTSSIPEYMEIDKGGIEAALDLLRGRMQIFCLVSIQRAIVHVLRIVEGTALDMMRIFVEWEAKWEQMQEDLLQEQVDEVVDTGHGVDDGKNYDFDGNLD